jgi:hypothetical protein
LRVIPQKYHKNIGGVIYFGISHHVYNVIEAVKDLIIQDLGFDTLDDVRRANPKWYDDTEIRIFALEL